MLHRLLDSPRLHIPFLFLTCLLLYFPFLGARDFWDHENFYAEVARIMLLERNYTLPQMNGQIWLDTPPLFFWLTLPLSWAAGEVNEWTMRLIPAMSGTVLILVSYVLLKKRFGARTAVISTLILATSLLTIHVERHIPVNMVFFLFVILSMFLLMEILVFDSSRSSHAYGVWSLMALACLTKGPIAVLLPILVAGFYLSVFGHWKKILALRPLAGATLFLLLTVPWYAYAKWQTSGDWPVAFFSAHSHLEGHRRPLYDYIVQFPGSLLYSAANFPLDFMPWIFLFIPAMINLWPERARVRNGATMFLLLWFLSVLLFPHLSIEGHSHYIFLVLPPAAVATGLYLDRLVSVRLGDAAIAWTHRFLLGFCFFLGFAGFVLPVGVAVYWPDLTSRALVLSATGIIGALGLFYARRNRNYAALIFGFAGLMVVINLLVQGLFLPPVNQLQTRPFAERIRDIVKPDQEMGIYLYHLPPMRDFNYYSRVKRIESLEEPAHAVKFLSKPGAKFILVSRRRMRQLKEIWHGELTPVLTQATGGPVWFFPPSGRWLLLRSCNGACDPISRQAASEVRSVVSR
jgi:4-amino-4-deoxy-L-arabinose transferase-like glycosyltransferase